MSSRKIGTVAVYAVWQDDFEHLVAHCDEDGAVMFPRGSSDAHRRSKLLVMQAEAIANQENHITEMVFPLL
jgi:hypothetical protein